MNLSDFCWCMQVNNEICQKSIFFVKSKILPHLTSQFLNHESQSWIDASLQLGVLMEGMEVEQNLVLAGLGSFTFAGHHISSVANNHNRKTIRH